MWLRVEKEKKLAGWVQKSELMQGSNLIHFKALRNVGCKLSDNLLTIRIISKLGNRLTNQNMILISKMHESYKATKYFPRSAVEKPSELQA